MDRTSKIIFSVIAAGLWANAAGTFLGPAKATAANDALNSLALSDINDNLQHIADGTCVNNKLC